VEHNTIHAMTFWRYSHVAVCTKNISRILRTIASLQSAAKPAIYIGLYIYLTLRPVQSQLRPDLASPPTAPGASVKSCRRSAIATGLDHKSPGVRGVRIHHRTGRWEGSGGGWKRRVWKDEVRWKIPKNVLHVVLTTLNHILLQFSKILITFFSRNKERNWSQNNIHPHIKVWVQHSVSFYRTIKWRFKSSWLR